MPNVKITDLSQLTSIPDDAILYIVWSGGDYQCTKADLLAGIVGGTIPSYAQVLTIGGREIKFIDTTTGEYTMVLEDKKKYLISDGANALNINIPEGLFSSGDEIPVFTPDQRVTFVTDIDLLQSNVVLPELCKANLCFATIETVPYLLITFEKDLVDTEFKLRAGNFTAEVNGYYKTNGVGTVTDPALAPSGGIYVVFVWNSGITTIGGVAYTEGSLIYRIYDGISAWTSFLINGGIGPTTTDALPEGTTNLYFLASRVRDTILTGFTDFSSAAVTVADTVLSAIGRLQGQLNQVFGILAQKKDTNTIICWHLANTFSDGANYFWGIINQAATTSTDARRRFSAPFTGNLKTVRIITNATTPTSAQDVVTKINNLTTGLSYTVGNVRYDNTTFSYLFTALTIPVNENDDLEFETVVPVLTTNGTACTTTAQVTFEKS